MDPFIKQKANILLHIGKREEALALIRESYKLSDEEAAKLLAVLEAEPVDKVFWNAPIVPQIMKWVGMGLAVVGFFILAAAIMMYSSVTNATGDYARTTATVSITEMGQGVIEVKFSYAYNNQAYTQVDRGKTLRKLNLHEGQVIDLLVNPDDPNDIQLPIAEPLAVASAMNLGGIGLGMIAISIVLWKLRGRWGGGSK